MSQRRWEEIGGAPGTFSTLALWGVPGGLIGSRLYSIVTSWQADTGGHWYRIFAIWQGGLGIWGGIAGGVALGLVGARRHHLRFRPLFDTVAPALALAQGIGRWGNYFNQELYGKPTSLPWAVHIDKAHQAIAGVADYQPTFLYESLWDLTVAGLIILAGRHLRVRRGYLFALYVALYNLRALLDRVTCGSTWPTRSDHCGSTTGSACSSSRSPSACSSAGGAADPATSSPAISCGLANPGLRPRQRSPLTLRKAATRAPGRPRPPEPPAADCPRAEPVNCHLLARQWTSPVVCGGTRMKRCEAIVRGNPHPSQPRISFGKEELMTDLLESSERVELVAAQASPVVVISEVGDPLSLGLAGFGMTAIVLSIFNAGLVSASLEGVVLPMSLFYGGLVVLLSGMWAFRRNETYPAVVLSAFGAFWLSFTGYVKIIAPGLPASTAHEAEGIFVLVWAAFVLYAAIPAIKTNVAVLAVMVGTFFTFLFVGLGAFSATDSLVKVGGGFGIATGLTAMYTSFAILANGMFGKTVLPVRPLA